MTVILYTVLYLLFYNCLCPTMSKYCICFQLKVISNDCDTLHCVISTVLQLFMSYYVKVLCMFSVKGDKQ